MTQVQRSARPFVLVWQIDVRVYFADAVRLLSLSCVYMCAAHYSGSLAQLIFVSNVRAMLEMQWHDAGWSAVPVDSSEQYGGRVGSLRSSTIEGRLSLLFIPRPTLLGTAN